MNRLDGDDKTYGYIVDYRDLFKSLDKTVTDYTSEAFGEYDDDDVEGLVSDRSEQDRTDLEDALDAVRALCEPVAPPKNTLDYQHYFVATTPGDADQIKENEPRRVLLYKSVASLVRAFAAVASDVAFVGYSVTEMASIKDEVAHYSAAKREVEVGAGEDIDMKQYEAGMRQLLDSYIHATPVEQVADLEKTLVELIVERGSDAIDSLPPGIRGSSAATAETIINNVRKTIVDEHSMNPRYYDHMSELLDALIEKQREEAEDYATYLHQLIELAKDVGTREVPGGNEYPEWASTPARRSIIDFAWSPADLTVDYKAVHHRIQVSKEHGWASGGAGKFKERALARELRKELPGIEDACLAEFIELLKNHDEYR